jgi:hypothetical protein
MEQNEINNVQPQKIYKVNSIWHGTFLGGPLVAGYLIAENFKTLNEQDKVKTTWFISIIATIIILGGFFLFPNPEKIPNELIPLIYTAIAYFIVRHYQGKKIAKYLENGGISYKWLRTFIIGLIGLIVTILPLIGYVYLSSKSDFTTKTYGDLKHEIIFDKSNILEYEVDNVARGLKMHISIIYQRKLVFICKS